MIGDRLLLRFLTVELNNEVPKANAATESPPAAMAMGAFHILVRALACSPPNGMMLQVIP